ncbi:YopX family protein [Lacticaseibacillus zeae]|uniref:YopX family protein n=1 Tax=Lacticaseibacillus zeae subsp. silagei TaxID=3068307 RepID=A0ABD7ZBZ0_LACZE|nr:YopX family protein [Lacticaseibacillus sp. NCIMB 15475]WLV84646.1 YopX family protein [Lacticaseibacillus sp. NCIMB 15475]
MKREIKFRAWQPQVKRIFEVGDIDFIKEEVMLCHWGWESLNDIDLIQYTGLHDKNGREIYEGDIVKNEYGKVMEVNYDPRSAAFGVGDYYFGTIGSGKILEVIGNIYEDGGLGDNKNSTTN